MANKISKSEVKKRVDFFFSNLEDKSPEDVRKIRKLAMSQKISLGKNKKLFCGKCLTPYKSQRIRIKDKMKVITCAKCGKISRWKIKLS